MTALKATSFKLDEETISDMKRYQIEAGLDSLADALRAAIADFEPIQIYRRERVRKKLTDEEKRYAAKQASKTSERQPPTK